MAHHLEAAEFASRLELEGEIERLIGILDTMDPDPDLEPSLGGNGWMHLRPDTIDLEVDETDDEPDLGWTLFESRFNRYPPDTSGGEPSMGSLECINQEKWSDGGIADLEHDKADDEPCLGSINSVCQVNWGAGGTTDVEEQCDDEGQREHS